MSGSEDTHSKWLRGSEVGIIHLLHRLNLFFFTLQLTRASTLHVVDLPFKEHHNFFLIFFSRTQYMSSAQQDLVPRHPSGKFSLHTRRHMMRQ